MKVTVFFYGILAMKTKKIKTLKALKSRLKKTLPEKISEVMDSYDNFAEQPVPEDAKGFSAHHSACKAAVVHAETLLKLAKWTDDTEIHSSSEDFGADIMDILAEAQAQRDGFSDED